MAAPASQTPEPSTLRAIVDAAKKAFDPSATAASRDLGLREYDALIARTATWTLLSSLNALIKPNGVPQWLRKQLMKTLIRLPLRPDGVRSTMEFLFSVHPSSNSNIGMHGPQKDGASITHEAVAVASRLLSTVPSFMTPDEWFDGIAEQLIYLMDGSAGKDLAKPAAQIIGFGILGSKEYGAPGSAGWNAFVQPLLDSINPSLMRDDDVGLDQDEVIDLSKDPILISGKRLEQSLLRLRTLVKSTPSPGLCRRLTRPVLLQLWALASWGIAANGAQQRFCKVARDIISTYLRLFGKANTILPLVHGLLYDGPDGTTGRYWKYRLTEEGEIEVVTPRGGKNVDTSQLEWEAINYKATILVEIVGFACSKEEISSTFLQLLQEWIQSAGNQARVDILPTSTEPSYKSAEQELARLTFLQKLMEKVPEKLVAQFDQLLDLICQVLKADRSSRLDSDIVAVVLSLLNLVITAPEFQKSDIASENLEIINTALSGLEREGRGDVSLTAQNLALLLQYREEFDQPGDHAPAANRQQLEDRRIYNLAMEYITGSNDNPPPVVSEGLNLLSNLILAESPILDIPAINVLMSTLLSESEDFINLRVIKMYTQLAGKHPKSTVREILDRYLDAQEKLSTDVRLRFGEALLQVIERLGATFSGEVAQQVSETLLAIAGRRGYRPNTFARQRREERLRRARDDRNHRLGVDDANPEDDDDVDMDEEERANNDILAQIVQGWESARGAEDIRMRTSALSIFGRALEVNIGGIGPTSVSAGVDLCANILALEPEIEKGILRRAAILVVLGFVRALDEARQARRSLGFGLTETSRQDILRTLQYVAATDNDGLVQQHAKDVVESLENWQMTSLLPQSGPLGPTPPTVLAGLHVNPESGLADMSGRPRPRIEEIE
ncbi:hypothetical protein HJFPF1_06591 [Paramyrothecium foliicola]|nr:hypothetical protein HJFPF1_06591 [Paramyrothecium foliicola]